jgi:CubicO group peptidase (beta-lactamase class C family)
MRSSFFVLLIIVLFLSFNSCKVGRFFIFNFADIKDHKKFPNRELTAAEDAFQFFKAEKQKVPKQLTINGKKYAFEEFLSEYHTVAFMIIKNDSILYESYFDGYDESSIVPSFSMAKSITSLLIGIAIEDGLIQSVEEPITNYIPELKANGFDKVSIEHLLQMTSGLDYNEGYYNPFGDVATFYYGRNLRKAITKMELETAPGVNFDYVSGSTQLLGLILERALKDKSITSYLQEKLWTPLEMEYDASWSIDKKKDGLEKTFCCLNARAVDFAKIGRLMLNKGNYKGQQLVPEEWIVQSTKVDTTNGSASYYQYQWWLPSTEGDFMAQGILGQYIYVNPEKNIIIIRLGKKTGKIGWGSIFNSLSKVY